MVGPSLTRWGCLGTNGNWRETTPFPAGRDGARPLHGNRKFQQPPGPAAHSGASAARSRGVGRNRSRDHPQRGHQPRTIPQSRLRRDSSCCGTQNSLFAKRSQNFDHCHSFLLASSATGGARKRPPLHKGAFRTGDADCRVASLLAMTVLNLCHSEEAQRADVGIRLFLRWTGGGPPYLGHGLRRPNFVPKFGASVRSSAPTEGQRCNSGLPASEQGCSPCIPGPGRRPPHCGSRDRSSLFAKGFDPLPDS